MGYRGINLKERDHLEGIGVGRRFILKCILKRWGGGYWICLAQNRDRWRAVVNAVMNLRVA
jgi:hypothetical protein